MEKTLTAIALQLKKNGYSPIPIRIMSKVPLIKNWSLYAEAPLSSTQINELFNSTNAGGIGVCCGRLIVVDIDTLDPEEAKFTKALAFKHFGVSTLERIGKSPKRQLYYRIATPIKSVKMVLGGTYNGSLEILSNGRQSVAYGIHPDTGTQYEWVDKEPYSFPFSELAEVSEMQVQSFLQEISGIYAKQITLAEFLGSNTQQEIVKDEKGLVVDGREGLLTSIVWRICMDNTKHEHAVDVEVLVAKAWEKFVSQADLSKPKGSNASQSYSIDDARKKVKYLLKKLAKSANDGAQFPKYAALFNEFLPDAIQDILTREIYYRDIAGKRRKVSEILCTLMSHAHDNGLSITHLLNHLERWGLKYCPRRMVIDIPEWDNVDRIKLVAKSIKCSNLSPVHVEQFLKQFGAKMFQRVQDPRVQNHCLILRGKQGIGKDFLITELFGSLGSYLSYPVVRADERDLGMILAQSILVCFSEFERTNKLDAGSLKNLITCPEVTFRRPYARGAMTYELRCSFLGTTNKKSIFTDSTGNRRFVVIEIESIEWDYPKDEGLQYLAQMLALAEENYKVSDEAAAVMEEYIKSLTPIDPEEEIVSMFVNALKYNVSWYDPDGEFSHAFVKDILQEIAQFFGMKSNQVSYILGQNGLKKRTQKGMVYLAKPKRCRCE